MKKYFSKVALFTSLFAATAVSAAENNFFYIGGQLGYGNTYQSPTNNVINSVSGNGGGLAGRFYGGYQFSRYVATEFGYTKFSNSSMIYSVSNDGFGNPASGKGTVNAYALDWVVKGILPLQNGVSLFGKLGIAGINENAGNVILTSSVDGTSFVTNISCNAVVPTFTLGAGYEINQNLATDFSWMRNQSIGNLNVKSTDLVTLGLSYYFI